MCLVKSISCKSGDEVKHLLSYPLFNFIFCRPCNECLALLVHNLRYFLADCSLENVRLLKGKPGKFTDNAHYLLLIEDNPIGVL